MSQTSYVKQPNTGAEGEPAFANDQPMKVESYVTPDSAIPFGRMLGKVSGEDFQCELPSSSSKFVGVSVRDLGKLTGQYEAADTVGVVSLGPIWVSPEEDVSADDAVYVRIDGKNQTQTITFSASIVTSNSIAVTVNGTDITQAFDTDDNTTLAALAVLIAAVDGVGSASRTGTHIVTVVGDTHGTDVTISTPVVTLGASQATAVVAETVASIPDTDKGKFRNDADSSTALLVSQARFLTSTTTYTDNSKKLAILDLNWPAHA